MKLKNNIFTLNLKKKLFDLYSNNKQKIIQEILYDYENFIIEIKRKIGKF